MSGSIQYDPSDEAKSVIRIASRALVNQGNVRHLSRSAIAVPLFLGDRW